MLLMASIDVNQDVGENHGKVAGTWKEGDNRPINIYNNSGKGPRGEPPDDDDDHNDRIGRLERFMFGDQLGDGVGYAGVLRQLTEIVKQQAEMLLQMRSMMVWLYVVTALLIFQGILMAVYTFGK